MSINYYRLKFRFREAWNSLWHWEKQSSYLNLIKNYRKLLIDLNSARRILEDYRIMYETERERGIMLSLIITEKLKTKNITYVCKHCGFRGKEYRDFCPGCLKDSSGKTHIDYYNSQK